MNKILRLVGRLLSFRSLSLAFPCVVISLSAYPDPPASNVTFELSPGIVVDGAKGSAYVVDKDERVAAVDLKSGNELWKADQAGTPVGLADNLLITRSAVAAAPTQLRIRVLDAFDGSTKTRADVSLPVGSTGSTVDSLNFRFEPKLAEPTLIWEATERPLGGVRPGNADAYLGRSPAGRSSPPKERTENRAPATPPKPSGTTRKYGAFSLDLSTGDVSNLPEATAPSLWAKAAEAPVAPANPLQIRSADGAHYITSERIDEHSYQWNVYSSGDNKLLGHIATPARVYPFFVSGERLVYDRPAYEEVDTGGHSVSEGRTLRAFDLNTGALLWSKEVKSRGRRGSVPP